MRILHVINSLCIGGAEKLIVDLLPLQIESGHCVELLLLNGEKSPFKEQLEKIGIKIHTLGMYNNIYNPLLLFKIGRYFKDYDIIHTHLFPAQYWVAIAKLFFPSKCKFITTEHAPHNRRRDIFMFRYLDSFIYNRYDKVVCISNDSMQRLCSFLSNFKKDRFAVVANGVNLDHLKNGIPYTKNEFIGISENCKLVLMVAGFKYPKDQKTVIEAIALMPEEYHVAFIGTGDMSECILLTQKLHLEKRVHFCGLRTDIPNVLKTGDIIVLASHYEGLSLSCIEGMSVGKPFVASDVNGLREIVSGAGGLFEDGNSHQLANLIVNIMTDGELYDLMAEKCVNRAMEYGIKGTLEEYEKIYRELVYLNAKI